MQEQHRLQRPNNSVKPSPLRGLGPGSYDHVIAKAAQRPGLPQALGLMHLLIRAFVLLLFLTLIGCAVVYRSTARHLISHEGNPGDVYCWVRGQPDPSSNELVQCQNEEAKPALLACADHLARENRLAATPVIRSQLKTCMRDKKWHLFYWGQVVI